MHDGAQQRLVALRIKLALESERLEHEAPQTAAELELLGAEVDETIDEVRAIAHGIYPSVLADRGLVEALARGRAEPPLSCTVEADGIGRHSQEIESAVYFACVGARRPTSAASATRIAITLWADESLRFEVRDDDAGAAASRSRPRRWLDRAARPPGRGRRGARDRSGARRGHPRHGQRAAALTGSGAWACAHACPPRQTRWRAPLWGRPPDGRCWAAPNGPP